MGFSSGRVSAPVPLHGRTLANAGDTGWSEDADVPVDHGLKALGELLCDFDTLASFLGRFGG